MTPAEADWKLTNDGNSLKLVVTAVAPDNRGAELGNSDLWYTNVGSFFADASTVNAHTGAYALVIPTGGSYLTQSFTNMLPNATYLYTAWVKDEPDYFGGTSPSYGTSTIIVGSSVYDLHTTTVTSADWRKIQFIVTTTADETGAALLLQHDGYDASYFDDINVQLLAVGGNLNFDALYATGTLDGWTSGGTDDPVIAAGEGTNGTDAAELPDGATLSQTFTGLQANTTYTFSAAGRLESGMPVPPPSPPPGSAWCHRLHRVRCHELRPETDHLHHRLGEYVCYDLSGQHRRLGQVRRIRRHQVVPRRHVHARRRRHDPQDAGVVVISDGIESHQYSIDDPQALVIATGSSNYTITFDQSGDPITLPAGLSITGTGNTTLAVTSGTLTLAGPSPPVPPSRSPRASPWTSPARRLWRRSPATAT